MSRNPTAHDQPAKLAWAMELLGEGSFEDLRTLGIVTTTTLIDEALALLEVPAAIHTDGGFSVAETGESLKLAARTAAERSGELVAKAVGVLCERGDFWRAGTVLSLTNGGVDGSAQVLAHCLEFIDSGFPDLVEEYVFDSAFGASAFTRSVVSMALGLLRSPIARSEEELARSERLLRRLAKGRKPADRPSSPSETALLAQARRLVDLYALWLRGLKGWDGQLSLAMEDAKDATPLLRSLNDAIRMHGLCLQGRLDDALAVRASAYRDLKACSVADSLLATELFLCRTLSGTKSTSRDRELMRSIAGFLDGLGFQLFSRGAESYVLIALGIADEASVIRPIQNQQERIARHPNARLAHGLALALACAYVRRHSYYAAYSQVRSAPEELADANAKDLACACYVVRTLCGELLGEPPLAPPATSQTSGDGMASLARLIYAVAINVPEVAKGVDGSPLERVFDDAKPSFVAKTLVALVLGSPWERAKEFRRCLPRGWAPRRRATNRPHQAADSLAGEVGRTPSRGVAQTSALYLASLPVEALPRLPQGPSAPPSPVAAKAAPSHLRLVADGGSSAAAGKAKAKRASGGAKPKPARKEPVRVSASQFPPLRLKVLGEFRVEIGGSPVEDGAWRRKAARDLLRCLAIVPNHTLTRAEACEFLWPDRDYILSRNSLYAVISCVRSTLGVKEGGPSYVYGEQGVISLNPKLVTVDVDEFEKLCREVLSREGDRTWRLTLCRHLGSLYAGGLRVPSQDVRGDFAAKQRKLHSLYVDVLVESCELALEAGLAKEALWFAEDARTLEPLREDATSALLRALAADGRRVELESAYEAYCSRLAKELFMAPPARLEALKRQLVAQLDNDEGQAESERSGDDGGEPLRLIA